MTRIPGIRSLFRLPASDGTVAGDVEEEIAFHLEERTRELVARGMDPVAARAEAERSFGDLREATAELEAIGRRRVRQVRRSSGWSELRQDVRYTWRGLLRSPGFTLVAVLTLALGIGAATAIFSVVNGVLLQPFGVSDADRLVTIREWRMDGDEAPRAMLGTVAPANFFDWKTQAQSFSDMSYFAQWPLNLTGAGEPQEAQVQMVDAGFFSTLGVQPMLGRGFLPEEDDPKGEDAEPGEVAVLSHALWQNRYGGDSGIVGQTIQVDGEPVQVVGVMGPDFRVLDQKPDLWMPLSLPVGNRTSMGRFVTVVARLKPGVTLERAREEMDRISVRLEEAYPDYNTDFRTFMLPLREEVVGEVRPALMVLLGAVAILLLIACTNVANLLLGRASARQREMAVRLSLGATRGRLVRQLLTESVVLSLVGGGIGVAAAVVGTRALVRSLPETVQLPRMDAVAIDGWVLAFAVGVTLITGLVFGLAPALAVSRSELQGTLRKAGRGSTGGSGAVRLRNGLVVVEVALALMLLVGAGLLVRSFDKLQSVDTGMHPQGVLTLRMSLGSEAYQAGADRRGFLARLLPALEGLPGVRAVGTVSHLPLSEDGRMGHQAFRADRPLPEPGQEPGVDFRIVGGDYFQAQGIRLLRGRTFDQRDHLDAPVTFVINEALARQQFPGEDPIGKRMLYPWPDLIEGEIVGVVADVHETSVTEQPAPALYHPFTRWSNANLHLVVRTTGDAMALAGAVREQVGRIDPNLPVASVRTMEQVLSEATARSRMSSYLFAGFAAIALLLAAIGLYGVISYGVSRRRGEIGVRVALGADRGRILRLIVGQGMMLTLAGLALGLVGALGLTRLLRSLLFGVGTTDPTTFVAVPLVLIAVTLLASYLPASRAARTDPATALRAE